MSGISFTSAASRNGPTFRAVVSCLHFGAHEVEHFRVADVAPDGVSPICGSPQHRSQVVSGTFGNDDVIPVQVGRPVGGHIPAFTVPTALTPEHVRADVELGHL